MSTPLATETVERVNRGVEKFSEYFHVLVNEPSVGLYRVREHIGRSVPLLVSRKQELASLGEEIDHAAYDIDYCRLTVSNLIHVGPVFDEIQQLLNRATALATTVRQLETGGKASAPVSQPASQFHSAASAPPTSPRGTQPAAPPQPPTQPSQAPPPPATIQAVVAPVTVPHILVPATSAPESTASSAVVSPSSTVGEDAPGATATVTTGTGDTAVVVESHETTTGQTTAPSLSEPTLAPSDAAAPTTGAADATPMEPVLVIPVKAVEVPVVPSSEQPPATTATEEVPEPEPQIALATTLSMVDSGAKKKKGKKQKELQFKQF